jgi:hypothetical protein
MGAPQIERGDMANYRNHKFYELSTRVLVLCGGLIVGGTAAAQTSPPTGDQATTEAPSEAKEPPAAELTAAPPPVAPPSPPPAGPPQSLIPDGEGARGPIAPVLPPAIPNADFGARMRGGLRAQNSTSPDKLNDVSQQWDTDVYMSGQIHRYLKWLAALTMSFPGTAGGANTVNVQPLDIFAHFAIAPEFNIMMGRMIVVADRFAPGGPWGTDEYVFAGFFPLVGPPALPKSGPIGRDVGTTVWGAPFGGHLKYYLGAFQLQDPALHPLYSGRLQVNLVGPEPGYNHPATYYGAKDIISIGVGGQFQKDGSTRTDSTTTPPTVSMDDFKMVTGDVTYEKNFAGVGTVSAIGAGSKFWGQYQPWKHFYLVSLGYMLPHNVGIGKPRLTVRYQGGKSPAADAKTSYVLDAQLSYSIHGRALRLMGGFRHGDTWLAAGGTMRTSNMLYLGVQLWDP